MAGIGLANLHCRFAPKKNPDLRRDFDLNYFFASCVTGVAVVAPGAEGIAGVEMALSSITFDPESFVPPV
jgi:hypothetical protein